ncbi:MULTISPECIES: hypothetical protein [unclassified Arsukibacterium]|uniref:hypothetical protein n=1 Tax=unclassified Arsukibacterium TaxID=2635278 RepID=UPI000C5F4687|nr:MULTISPECIES: hypothetical protein [unclassified Arsukibacterium]MAA95923.1 hypothetical protein [Rheinheimera sp.]MBM34773.1 hypothetical protein [Rheinheimera sp.]HAW91643.1 hypothetical protein [Candidatus Azambacteria bacterium]|tara:strand:- start:32640 stop:33359 length:720 start_codon:yes stop_codon:yes gene_type:complete
MKISDEMLSAFLDAALPEHEMEQVRQQLMHDEQLTERMADLAMVDSLVLQHYQQIDQQPMPAGVLQLLDNNEKPASANVVAFPWWRRAQQHVQQHAAAVACIALFAGYGLSQLSEQRQGTLTTLNSEVAQLLSSAPSGHSYAIAQQQFIPQLSFISQQGDFCRQYTLQDNKVQSENIACRTQDKWVLQASLSTERNLAAGNYQTATGGHALDNVLDSLMAGPALSQAAEKQYLTDRNTQ